MDGVYNSDGESNLIYSDAAWIVPTITGSLSAASSILIMSVILRSHEGSRFTSYHIIMLFMSFWDAVASIAIAFTTIPMPSDVHEVYPFSGISLGTIGTCRAQGFLIMTGTFLTISSNCALNTYYLCSIRYNMTEEKIKKIVLPIMLVFCTSFSLPIPVVMLEQENFNPQPYSNFCSFTLDPYPTGGTLCDSDGKEDNLDCIHRLDSSELPLQAMAVFVFTALSFFIILSSLVVIVMTAFRADIQIRRSRRISRRSGMVRLRSSTRNIPPLQVGVFNRTKAMLFQACMYVVAYMLTHVWLWIIFGQGLRAREETDFVPSKTLLLCLWIFRPLQGFFNSVIFIYQKAYSLCQANRRSQLRFFEAVRKVIMSPSVVPTLLISGIELAEEADERRAEGLPNQFVPVRRRDNELTGRIQAGNATQVYTSTSNDNEVQVDAVSVAAFSDSEDPNVSSRHSINHDDFSCSLSTPSGRLSNIHSENKTLANVVEMKDCTQETLNMSSKA